MAILDFPYPARAGCGMIQVGSNPLLDHVWGGSPGADRVWAQIAPIAPSTKPWERVFVVLQAFIDDSRRPDGTFVLGGYIATAAAWAKFSKEWEELLPLTMRGGPRNVHRFKMSEMKYRMDYVPAFYDVIAKHAITCVACILNINDLNRALKRVWIDNAIINWTRFKDPYYMSFFGLIDGFHSFRATTEIDRVRELTPLDKPIDFYFDNQSSKTMIEKLWDDYVAQRADEFKHLYGAKPRFKDDEIFLPLQAADFWAWWVSKSYAEGTLENLHNGEFGKWKTTKIIPGVDIIRTEETLVDTLVGALRTAPELTPDHQIYDVGRAETTWARMRKFFQDL